MTRPETVEALAEYLTRIHFDGTGCGTAGGNACSNCCGPSPMSAHEIVTALLEAIEAGQVPGLVTSERLAQAWDEGHRNHEPVAEFGDTPCDCSNPYRREGGVDDE